MYNVQVRRYCLCVGEDELFEVLTEEHLLEYKKETFTGAKANWTICSKEQLSYVSPVKEFWEYAAV